MSALRTAKPLLQALTATGLAVVAFSALRGCGLAAEPSLTASLILAGMLNIGTLASLNGEAFLPTSHPAIGEP